MTTTEWIKVEDYAPWVGPDDVPESFSWQTNHVPDDVLGTPFTLTLDSQVIKDSPREGGYWVSLRFGDRDNPKDLTQDEKEYIVKMVAGALDLLPYSSEEEAA